MVESIPFLFPHTLAWPYERCRAWAERYGPITCAGGWNQRMADSLPAREPHRAEAFAHFPRCEFYVEMGFIDYLDHPEGKFYPIQFFPYRSGEGPYKVSGNHPAYAFRQHGYWAYTWDDKPAVPIHLQPEPKSEPEPWEQQRDKFSLTESLPTRSAIRTGRSPIAADECPADLWSQL